MDISDALGIRCPPLTTPSKAVSLATTGHWLEQTQGAHEGEQEIQKSGPGQSQPVHVAVAELFEQVQAVPVHRGCFHGDRRLDAGRDQLHDGADAGGHVRLFAE